MKFVKYLVFLFFGLGLILFIQDTAKMLPKVKLDRKDESEYFLIRDYTDKSFSSLDEDSKQALIKEALGTVRQTRESIDPELLERVRAAIGKAAEAHQDEKYKAIQAERVPVDMKKNLNIIMKYMELVPENKALEQELKAFLTRHQNLNH